MKGITMNTLEMFRLDGKTAIITGASRGLGKEMAIGLGHAGANVVITGRDAATLAESAQDITAEIGRDVMTIVSDVTSKDDMLRMAAKTAERFGTIDILVNNAGTNIRRPFEEYEPEEFKTIIDTNVHGVFLCTQAVLPVMKKQSKGRIINIGSMMGVVGMPTRVPYAASKGAVHQITKVLAQEMAEFGITVNTIAPGPFMTEMNKAVLDQPEVYNFFIERIPLGHWADPEELRGVVVFFASEASSYVTGTELLVDGGWTSA